MLYDPPLVLVSDFYITYGVCTPRVHRVEQDGEGAGLYARVYLEREICLALGLGRLVQSRHHHDHCRPLGPGHAPEVLDRVHQRPLCRDVTRVIVVTLLCKQKRFISNFRNHARFPFSSTTT